MTSPETKKYPNPVYAAAGAGDLAYQKLRTLPGKVAELREKVSTAETDSKLNANVEKFRAAAVRNAQAAQDRASAIYAQLVARGEQVVRSARTPVSGTVAVKPTTELVAAPEATEE